MGATFPAGALAARTGVSVRSLRYDDRLDRHIDDLVRTRGVLDDLIAANRAHHEELTRAWTPTAAVRKRAAGCRTRAGHGRGRP